MAMLKISSGKSNRSLPEIQFISFKSVIVINATIYKINIFDNDDSTLT